MAEPSDWESTPVKDDWEAQPVAEAKSAPASGAGDWEEMQLDTGSLGPGPVAPPPSTKNTGDLTAQDVGYGAAPVVQPTPQVLSSDQGLPKPDFSSLYEIGGVMKSGNPFAVPDYVAGKFKAAALDPIVNWAQSKARNYYLSDLGGQGEQIRKQFPGLAVMVESAAKPFIGSTGFNKGSETGLIAGVGSTEGQDPRAVQGIADMQEYYGQTGAAAMQAITSGVGELPFWLIPGVGEGAAAKGFTMGLTMSVLDTENKMPLTTAFGGAAIGVGAEGLIAGYRGANGAIGAKFDSWVARDAARLAAKEPLMHPVALLGTADEPAFAKAVMDLPPPLSEVAGVQVGVGGSKITPPRKSIVAVAADVGPDGVPVFKALHADAEGLSASALKEVPHDTKVVITQELRDRVEAEPDGWNSELGRSVLPPPKETSAASLVLDATEYVNPKAAAAVSEGSVLVIEGNGGDGTARLYEINSYKLQQHVMRNRILAEVEMPEGKAHGFLVPTEGGYALMPPDAAENFPRGRSNVLDVTLQKKEGKVKILDDAGIQRVLRERDAYRAQLEENRAKSDAFARAYETDIQNGGNGNGDKLPPAPPNEPPGETPPPNPHNVQPDDGPKASWLSKMTGLVGRNLIGPTARGPMRLADAASEAFSVSSLERLSKDLGQSLNETTAALSKLPVERQKQAQLNLNDYILGNLSKKDLIRQHPELSKGIADRIETEKQMTQALELELERLQIIGTEEERTAARGLHADEQLEDYAAQLYWRDIAKPGQWRNIAKKDTDGYNAIVAQIQKDIYSEGKYKGASYDDAQRLALAKKHFDYLAGKGEPTKVQDILPDWLKKKLYPKANKETGSAYADAMASTKQRKEFKWYELAAMGEVNDPVVRLAVSRGRQRQLLLHGQIWEAVAANREFSMRADAANASEIQEGWVSPSETNSRKFGLARGMWIREDVHDALVTIPLMQRNQSSFMQSAMQTLKWNQTVGNPGSWVNNSLENLQGMMLSNMVNPWTFPLKIGRGMHTYTKDFTAHMAAPGMDTNAIKFSPDMDFQTASNMTTTNVARGRFLKAIEKGWIGSEYSTHEFRASSVEWHKFLNKQSDMTGGKINALDVYNGFINAKNRPLDWLSGKYAAIDTLSKYATGIAGLEKAGVGLESGRIDDMAKAMKFLDGTNRIRPGMSHDQILEEIWNEVTRRIHFSFPMMDRVAPAVAAVANSAAGGLGNRYFKVKAEQYRVYGQLAGRVLSEPGMKANMLGYTAMVGSLAAGPLYVARQLNGVNQDTVDAAFASAPDAVQRFKPSAMALWGRKDNGRLTFINTAHLLEPLSWAVGDPTQKAMNILTNFAQSPINGNMLEPNLLQLLSQGGLADPSYMGPKAPQWAKDSARLLGQGVNAFGPGIVRNTMNTLQRGQVGYAAPGGRMIPREPQSALATGVNMVAGPGFITEAGSKADMDRTLQEASIAYKQAVQEYKDLLAKNEGQSTGSVTLPLNKSAAIPKALANVNQKIERFKQLEATFKKAGYRP